MGQNLLVRRPFVRSSVIFFYEAGSVSVTPEVPSR